ncbi:S8 family serine peptidase [Moorena producens]|uniref:S8 family serine peptidase n=1 Tax=Moorena producens TaxID=1155739 RepID=UPI003C722766
MKIPIQKTLVWLLGGLSISGVIAPALGLDTSISEAGINVYRLHQPPYNLTGRKIAIGQVEIGRPGLFGKDKAAVKNRTVTPAGVFYRNTPAQPNTHVDEHAAMVAAVMVSRDKGLRGVAPDAKLYASAVGSLSRSGQPEECLAAQHIAQQNGSDVRAINFSFGESLQRDPREEAVLDGNALLTLCIDWSARVHDVLYVIAGNQGKGGIPIPTDNFNGINAAYTAKRQGVFNKVDFANLSALPVGIGRRLIRQEINVGSRRSINLVAPGNKISLYDLKGKVTKVSGTSFAAPHITGVVALLQEFGDSALRKLRSRQQKLFLMQSLRAETSNTGLHRLWMNWSTDSRRHQVMKAVLLNSADKIQDLGDGMLLGMSRTIRAKDNHHWLESDAYQDPKIPLDMQMGTGHLNGFRAYQQFKLGQWSPSGIGVPPVGWDYRTVEKSSYRDYVLTKPLAEGSFISLTLAWDRLVELEDQNNNDAYDVGERFSDRGLNNLDLYLMPVGEEDTTKSVCASISEADAVEHIFCQVPAPGRYKIRVQYQQQLNQPSQAYALAWWTVPDAQ